MWQGSGRLQQSYSNSLLCYIAMISYIPGSRKHVSTRTVLETPIEDGGCCLTVARPSLESRPKAGEEQNRGEGDGWTDVLTA